MLCLLFLILILTFSKLLNSITPSPNWLLFESLYINSFPDFHFSGRAVIFFHTCVQTIVLFWSLFPLCHVLLPFFIHYSDSQHQAFYALFKLLSWNLISVHVSDSNFLSKQSSSLHSLVSSVISFAVYTYVIQGCEPNFKFILSLTLFDYFYWIS